VFGFAPIEVGLQTVKFRLNSLVLSLRRAEVAIDFADVSYFWGQMGAGKTSIARMVDYCLGGDIQLSPAMQSEFAAAALNLSLARMM
jgi:Holliday junction resolvasome RuvABC ATP-dependent DNA helicase subunit